jgi:hypothetical protein
MFATRLSGRIAAISALPGETGKIIGDETWDVLIHPDGLRTLRARALLLDEPVVVRDVHQTVDRAYHPHDGYARIVVGGQFRGSGWFRFTDALAECEAFTTADGRVSQSFPITRNLRGFGTHALQSDAWLLAKYDLSQGPGTQYFRNNLMTSIDHRGSTGPFFMTTNSGLEYVGRENVSVPAGAFDCHHFRFVATSNNHPPYDVWVTADGHYTFVHAELAGERAARFDLIAYSEGV